MSNHCSQCGADDDSPHWQNCSLYRPPTAQEFADADDRIETLERTVADLETRLEALEAMLVP
jgi:uncharacterized protein YceH (UPF0502 family)